MRSIRTCRFLGILTLAFMFSVAAAMTACSRTGEIQTPSSFHYTATTSITYSEGDVERSEEVFYQASDSVRVIAGPDGPFSEIVMIGTEAWTRDSAGWSSSDADAVRNIGWPNVRLILELTNDRNGFQEVGAGPLDRGEVTRRYRLAADLGDRIAQTLESVDCALPAVKELFVDGEGTIEITVGEDTGLIHSMSFEFESTDLTTHTQVSIDTYNEAIEITAPVDAASPKATPSATLCSPND